MSKIFWGLFLVLTFVITLPISWWGLSKVDFAYPVLYEKMNIAQHISTYAPKNTHNKNDFVQTSKVERLALFHGVVDAIQNHGSGLDLLFYTNNAQQNKKLFTEAEVIHLTDVANLLDHLKPVALGAVILWIILTVTLLIKKINLPSRKQLISTTVVIVLLIASVLAIGPEKVFNQLHVWVFPENHQWFFYYEESIMSTMMKAPDLFAYIAGAWALFSVILSVFLLSFLRLIFRKH